MAFHSVLVWLFERCALAEKHARRWYMVFNHVRSECSSFAKAQKYLFRMDACRKSTYYVPRRTTYITSLQSNCFDIAQYI